MLRSSIFHSHLDATTVSHSRHFATQWTNCMIHFGKWRKTWAGAEKEWVVELNEWMDKNARHIGIYHVSYAIWKWVFAAGFTIHIEYAIFSQDCHLKREKKTFSAKCLCEIYRFDHAIIGRPQRRPRALPVISNSSWIFRLWNALWLFNCELS